MAIYYVYSGAAGSNNGSSWANAFTTLTTAFATEAAGDTLYVAHDHSESTAALITLTSSGTISNPTKIVCVDRAGTVPPVSADRRATAQVATTGNSNINLQGFAHYDGIIFIAGNTTSTASISAQASNGAWTRFDNCSLRLGATGATNKVNVGNGAAAYVEFNNTTVSFSAVTQSIAASASGVFFKWRNTPNALLGTIPTTLFILTGGGEIECIGVDLSAAGSGKTIAGSSSSVGSLKYRFVDCKLDAAVTRSTVPGVPGANEVEFVRCGASGVNYGLFHHRTQGTLDHELTIVRSGGATDQTTPIAWKIITTVNCMYSLPFTCPPIAIWNDTTGSAKTATVEGIWGGGAVPLDDEIWVEVEYLGDASSPQGSFVNDGKANLLATAANQTTSTVAWGGSTTKFKLGIAFTAQQKGWVYARVKCAKASSTFYVDPLVTLT